MIFIFSLYFRIPTSSPLGDPAMASTAALLGLHSRPGEAPGSAPGHPMSPTQYLHHLHTGSSPTSSLRLPSHADYLSAAATAQRLGELQQAAQASLDVPFSLDGKLQKIAFSRAAFTNSHPSKSIGAVSFSSQSINIQYLKFLLEIFSFNRGY